MADTCSINTGDVVQHRAGLTLQQSLVACTSRMQADKTVIGMAALQSLLQLVETHSGVVVSYVPCRDEVVLVVADELHLQLVGIADQLAEARLVHHGIVASPFDAGVFVHLRL